jgi:acyl-coenzyme A thioesterase PaaI-like protein
MATMLETIRRAQRGEISPPPVAKPIGFTLASIDPGCAVVEFSADSCHANPMGTLHGGILCDIADAAMGMAYASTLAEGESFTTLGLVECDIVDDQGRLVARASSTCMMLRGDDARGR